MLRKAGVVDAGAKGFVQWLEGMSALIRGDPIVARREPLAAHGPSEPMAAHEPSAVAAAEFPTDGGYRFCTEALVRGPDLPADDAARHVLREFGDSLIVIRGEGLLKVHVHTDDPEGVFAYLRGVGRLESHKAEDMTAQKRTLESSTTGLARRPLAIVTDSACDLPEGVIRGHGIHVVPLSLVYEDRALRDGIDIDADTFIQRLRRGEHPRTSQPPPAAFLEAFRHAAQDAEQVLGFTVAGALSGTLGSAQAAARSLDDPAAVQVVDSRGASLCQGLLVLRAAELAELGTPTEEIIAEVQRIRDQSGLYFTVDTFDRLVASGRVSRGRGWLAGALRIKPILRLTPEGSIEAADKVRGSKALLPRVLDHLTRDVGSARNVRFGVVHVDAPDTAEAVRTALVDRFGEKEILVEPATPVLATHLGRRAWGVAYQVED
ncbi:MAG TPA: DegV family protein, partial [Longimicrobiales bacterium]|nr:DegV family protein [Longimicrobiales bacterium]